MQIQGRKLNMDIHYLDKVTYVPRHCEPCDGERGVIIRWNDTNVFVLYCDSRTVQATHPNDLVWG